MKIKKIEVTYDHQTDFRQHARELEEHGWDYTSVVRLKNGQIRVVFVNKTDGGAKITR